MKSLFFNMLSVALLVAAGFFLAGAAEAASYPLDRSGASLVGGVGAVRSRYEDTLLDLARLNGLGYNEIKLANPGVDTWLPGAGRNIVLPTHFVLPDAPRRGIVLNIPEMRLYYYPQEKEGQAPQVITHPVGIGREGWSTPYINTRIIEKKTRPYWFPPESIRREHAEQGDPLPEVVPPGPDNPLGNYALRLGQPEYIIHGTNRPFGIGMRVSHGCIRLYPEDIKSLYAKVRLRTPVNIVNQPYKVGRQGDRLYLEAHPYLAEDKERFAGNMTAVVDRLISATQEMDYEVDWDRVREVISESVGMPIEIGRVVAAAAPAATMGEDAAAAAAAKSAPLAALNATAEPRGAARR